MSIALPSSSFVQPHMFEAASHRAWPFGTLARQSYDLIMIDPPWHYELRSEAGEGKAPQGQYDTMSLEEIAALPVADLAREHCLLWMWATFPMVPQQLEVMASWGFRYVTGGAWNKRRWGPGYVMRSVCEPFFIGKRGEPRVRGASISNHIEESRREHSRKPEECYRRAEAMMPDARRCEVFSCTNRRGWDAFGNEAGVFSRGETRKRRARSVAAEPPILQAIYERSGA